MNWIRNLSGAGAAGSSVALAALCSLALGACERTPSGSTRYSDLTDAPDLGVYAVAASLAPVATSGAYQDLSGSPDLGVYATAASLAPVAASGAYQDLSGAPDLGAYATAASLAPVAFSGAYQDLTDAPDLGAYATAASLAPVAISGAYQDLTGVPGEVDPKVGALVAGKWCRSDGVKLDCDVEPPAMDYTMFDGVLGACNVTGTRVFDGASGEWGPCSNPGFFVLSSTTFTGNLGGLAGADAICLADLQANAWMGKPAEPLDASRVKAFLCTSATCNNLEPRTHYTFATSGSPDFGGASFITSGSGTGPRNSDAWNSPRTFGVNAEYFSGRGQLTADEWPTFPDPEPAPAGFPAGSLHCANWTNGTHQYGNWESAAWTAATDGRRWWSRGTHDYCRARRLICFVNP